MIIYAFDGVENIVGKGEKIFYFSHNVLKRLLSHMHQKASLCGNWLKNHCYE